MSKFKKQYECIFISGYHGNAKNGNKTIMQYHDEDFIRMAYDDEYGDLILGSDIGQCITIRIMDEYQVVKRLL